MLSPDISWLGVLFTGPWADCLGWRWGCQKHNGSHGVYLQAVRFSGHISGGNSQRQLGGTGGDC